MMPQHAAEMLSSVAQLLVAMSPAGLDNASLLQSLWLLIAVSDAANLPLGLLCRLIRLLSALEIRWTRTAACVQSPDPSDQMAATQQKPARTLDPTDLYSRCVHPPLDVFHAGLIRSPGTVDSITLACFHLSRD